MLLTPPQSRTLPAFAAGRCVKYILLLLVLTGFAGIKIQAQRVFVIVRGTVSNQFTKERIPFASVTWKKGGQGVIADSSGVFRILSRRHSPDTLLVSCVGFQALAMPITPTRDTTVLTLFLENALDGGAV